MPLFVLLAKFGISAAFVIIYVCNVDIFPALFMPIAFGITNFTGAVSTIGAPIIGEMKGEFPMFLFTTLSAIGLILSYFITTNKEEELKKASKSQSFVRQTGEKFDIDLLESSVRYQIQ